MQVMSFTKLAFLVVAVGVALAACSPASDAGATGAAGPRTIEVIMSDELRFDPDAIAVSAGETVRFVVTNSGQIVHEFYIGDEAAQAAHEEEMRAGGMQHDDPSGISVEPGQTGELEFTFEEAGELLIGCHEPGHYDGGMMATVTVEG